MESQLHNMNFQYDLPTTNITSYKHSYLDMNWYRFKTEWLSFEEPVGKFLVMLHVLACS